MNGVGSLILRDILHKLYATSLDYICEIVLGVS
jgi:hypothetical protein